MSSALIDFAVETSLDFCPFSRQWTEAEDEFIRANILTLTMAEIGQHLGRTEAAIDVHMKRTGLAPASRQPGWYTGEQVARILCMDSHSITKLCQRGFLKYTRLPSMTMTKSVRQVSFWVWAVNPDNWIYFNPRRVRDPHLRRLIELRRKRWPDEWWTTGQVAEYWGLACSNTVAAAIMRGKLPAVKWGNWYVKRSVALAHPFYPGGSGHTDRSYTPAAEQFVLKAKKLGLEWDVIARMMKKNQKYLEYRYYKLQRKKG